MSLNRPDLTGRIWYKWLMFSCVVSVVFLVIRFGSEISIRSDAEARVVEPWTQACVAAYDENACNAALDEDERGCLRASQYIDRGEVEHTRHVFFECMNERNRNVRLEVPEPESP